MSHLFPADKTPTSRSLSGATQAKTVTPSETYQSYSLKSRQHRPDTFPETPNGIKGFKLAAGSGDGGLLHFSASVANKHQYEALFLGDHSFGKAAVQALADLLMTDTTVKHLILPRNGIGDGHMVSEFAKAGLADLFKVNHVIGWVVLNNNEIGDLGAADLADGLKENTGVKHVVLADNEIGDDGAVALAEMLKENRNIESLFLQGNPIGNRGVEAFIAALKDYNGPLKRLDLRDISDVSPHLLAQLKDMAKSAGIRLFIR